MAISTFEIDASGRGTLTSHSSGYGSASQSSGYGNDAERYRRVDATFVDYDLSNKIRLSCCCQPYVETKPEFDFGPPMPRGNRWERFRIRVYLFFYNMGR
jgi:hypothetical protein